MNVDFLIDLKKNGVCYLLVAIKPDDSEVYHAKYFVHPPKDDEPVKMEIEMMTNPELAELKHMVINQDYEIKLCTIDQIIALIAEHDLKKNQ
jgi:hypothetical protein